VKTGLNINTKKTEVMRINNKKQDPITLHDEDLIEVEKFVYLGSVVNKDGGTDEDIKSRINKARHAFNTHRPIWNSSALSLLNLQHQRQVCPTVWLRNMENYQVKHPQAADLYQQMP